MLVVLMMCLEGTHQASLKGTLDGSSPEQVFQESKSRSAGFCVRGFEGSRALSA